jgi:hypothetical protein
MLLASLMSLLSLLDLAAAGFHDITVFSAGILLLLLP